MTRRRWIADEVSGDRVFLLGKNAEHLARVLRARIGQQFEIATPDGIRLSQIVDIQPNRVTLSPLESVQTAPAANRQLHLYLSVFKFDRMEWAIEKCTELGIASLRPIIAQRTEKHLATAAEKRAERWRRIVHEAAQQSRRPHEPAVSAPQKLTQIVSIASGCRIVLWENEKDVHLSELVGDHAELSLAIGPEGGWTDAELGNFRQSGWSSASLGRTILRAETAAIAAVAIAGCGK